MNWNRGHSLRNFVALDRSIIALTLQKEDNIWDIYNRGMSYTQLYVALSLSTQLIRWDLPLDDKSFPLQSSLLAGGGGGGGGIKNSTSIDKWH